MNKFFNWYNQLSKRTRNSIIISATIIGMISTVLSILGISLCDLKNTNLFIRIGIVIGAFLLLCCIIYVLIGLIYKKSISLTIRNTPVTVVCGNIFETEGLRVIGCDTHFDTRIDDIVISKKSLHGQLFLEHGNIEEIKKKIEEEANRRGLQKNSVGLYDFPLGTVIKYDSSVDNNTYLMLATTKLNAQYEAHTNMAEFEHMLMQMWKEISRVYASNDIALPLLGSGIVRFDDGPKENDSLLRCMLCTLNSSGVSFNSKIKIVIFGNNEDIPLYEYKNIFHV